MRNSWRDLPIAVKGLIVVAIPVFPLLLTAILYTLNERAAFQAQADAERAAANRTSQVRLLGLALQAESAVRGYLLGADPSQLELKRQAEAQAATALGDLAANIRDPLQRERLALLQASYTERIAALDAVLRTHQLYGLNSPEMAVQVRRGATAMNALRAQTTALLQRNTELFVARTERADFLQTRTALIVLVGAGAGVLGGVLAALLFTTGITRRVIAATENASRLAAGEVIPAGDPAGDEIGTLQAAMHRAGDLLAARDRELHNRMAELEGLTKELEAFSYSVSHDLRAPLRHIAGFAAMLRKSAGETLTAQQRRYIETIVEAAGRMGRLIDDLLAFSRTGRTEMRRHAVDLDAIVRDVRGHLAGEINGRVVDWRLQALPTVHGDSALLRVVFDNLLANAVKYTSGRDRASIEVGTQTDDSGERVIYVRDNGVGFDMQYQHKLFGVFQRLHSSDEFEGTGIGLATVRRIVARHGGRIWAEGRPNEGATFYMTFPEEETRP